MLSNSVCNHTCDYQIRFSLHACLVLSITHMITDHAGLHSVLPSLWIGKTCLQLSLVWICNIKYLTQN